MAAAAPAAHAPRRRTRARGLPHLAPGLAAGDAPAWIERARGAPAPDPAEELLALARAGAPLRRAVAQLAGRLERLRGWEPLGYARRRDHAAERLGLSGRQLQELAHVDRAFAALPELERAFVSGRLGYTQARLLARVATPEEAERWIAYAASVTARELSREVRAIDARAHDLLHPETDEEGESENRARETVFVRCSPVVRAKWHRARFWASRMEGHPVPPWKVAEGLAAEALSALPLDPTALRAIEADETRESSNGCALQGAGSETLAAGATGGAPTEAPTSNGCATQDAGTETLAPTARAAPAAPPAAATSNGCAPQDPFLASLLHGLDLADAFELDARLRRALAAEQRRAARMAPWLLAVARGRLYQKQGCPSLGAFARERLGISTSQAEALLRLERAGESCPALREAWRSGRLSWPRAQLLVPLVKRAGSAPWHAAWVALAERISVRRLADEVARALAHAELAPPPLEPPAGNWDDGGEGAPAAGEAGDAPDPQTGARPTLFPKSMAFFFTAPREVARVFRGALATVQRRIEAKHHRTASESEALEAMLDHAFETWGLAHAELQREHRVFARDGWRCTVPGCTSYGNLQDHHLEYRSHGGSNALSNRTTLCAWHHLRGEHAKVVRCRGRAPARLRFELGLRPGRPPLARYRSGDVIVS